MLEFGKYNRLKVLREADFGVYLDDGDKGLLLPLRFIPKGLKVGDEIDVFVYHDGEDRPIATTQKPYAQVGEIANLKVIDVTPKGAFLDFGLMKDLFVATKQQRTNMRPNCYYLVKLYIDEQTGRIAATEKFDHTLQNDTLTVKERDEVDLIVYRRTDIGYVVIINNQHTGVIHHNEIYRPIQVGDKFKGTIKKIYEDTNNIDVVAGKMGYSNKVTDEASKILQLLKDNRGFLPYSDKSSPEEIYDYFKMSKKVFKMTLGNLYKERKIEFVKAGIKLAD